MTSSCILFLTLMMALDIYFDFRISTITYLLAKLAVFKIHATVRLIYAICLILTGVLGMLLIDLFLNIRIKYWLWKRVWVARKAKIKVSLYRITGRKDKARAQEVVSAFLWNYVKCNDPLSKGD